MSEHDLAVALVIVGLLILVATGVDSRRTLTGAATPGWAYRRGGLPIGGVILAIGLVLLLL